MAAAKEDKWVECGFCCRRNEALEEPKCLPCGHIHCFGCLSASLASINLVKCPLSICGEVFDVTLASLPSNDVRGGNVLCCDVCVKKGKGQQKADIYCIQCDKKFCTKHLESHDDILENHTIISIEIYKTQQAILQKSMCEEHKDQPYNAGCKKCLKVICVACLTEIGSCTDAGNHELMPLDELVKVLKKEINDLKGKMMDKEETMCELFKLTSKKISEYDDAANEMVQLIHQIRDGQMRELSGGLVQNPLKVLVKSRRRQRLQSVTRKLKLMSTLHQTQPTVQQLLSSSDYVGALDIISTAQDVLNKELSGVQSFRHLGSQLAELEKAINIIIGEEFLTFITKDLNKPLSDANDIIDEDKFTAVYMGLLRQNSLEFISLYKEEATATIKAIVKQTVINYVSASDTFNTDNSTLADQMRSLNFNKWLLLMEDVFHNLLIVVNRVKTLGGVMKTLSCEAAGLDATSREIYIDNETENEEETTSSIVSQQNGGQTIITEMFADKICKELRDLLIKTCEYANERCSKVISARSKDMFIERLTSHEFFTLMSSVERFAKVCDQMCGTKISTNSVRGCLQGYNIKFLNKFHEERKNKLILLLNNERWRAAEVPADLQALLTHCELCEQLTLSDGVTEGDSRRAQQHVLVGNRRFVIVGTAMALVRMIIEYCTCLEDLPKSAPDILTKLTDIIKFFNSRSSQLVLGAGALELVGLKTISAKNLALLQSSLELVLYYLPLLRTQFSVYIVETKALMLRHLDTLTNEYKEHIGIVRGKLRELASAMIDSCVNQWEIRAPMPSLCFRTLCKQLKKFYEATCDIIEPSQLLQLFREVNAMVRGKLKDRLGALNITLLTGPQQGLIMADIAYFMENCSTFSSSQTKTSVKLSLSLNDIIVSR